MANRRLLNWRQIAAEKIPRSRSWLKARARSDPSFPKPAFQATGASTLFFESEIDAWLEHFVAQARATCKANKRSQSAPKHGVQA